MVVSDSNTGLMKESKNDVEFSAVMPCLNEEQTLATCVNKAFSCFQALGIKGEVVIADNGSTDRSVEIAEALGARVVHQPVKGYGAALQAGIMAARGQYCIMADCDDSYDWSAMEPFIQKLREGYDLVMGSRLRGSILPGAMPPLHRYFGNPVLSGIMNIFFGTGVSDAHCGMRGFSKKAFTKMDPCTTGMEFATEMVVRASNKGLRITEVPITLYPDGRNRPPHLRSFRDGWRHLRFMLFYAPDYLYIVPGILFLGIGAFLQLLLLKEPVTIFGFYMGIHWLGLGCLLALLGVQILFLGAFAKAFAQYLSFEMSGWIFRKLLNWFSLEAGIVTGLALLFLGVSALLAILVVWVMRDMGYLGSIHTVFVAATVTAIGVQIVFSSFLLSLFLTSRKSDMNPFDVITPPDNEEKDEVKGVY